MTEHTAENGARSPYPCETCGGPVYIIGGEPVCITDRRNVACIGDTGCDGRSHSLPCNDRYYGLQTRVIPPGVTDE